MIKSTVVKQEEVVKEKPFPKLMIANGVKDRIVLFTDRSTGTVVYDGSDLYQVGYYSSGWLISVFVPFHGTIQLSNE